MESDNSPRKQLSVLMVTGVYYPEVNGAANQCRQLVRALKRKVNFMVLATTRNPNLPLQCQVDGIDVFRIFLGRKSVFKSIFSIPNFILYFLSNRNEFQIVHLHGFSNKSMILVSLAKIFRKKVVILLTSVGHDDHRSMKNRGLLANWFFSKADLYVGLSPRFHRFFESMESKENNFRLIPNGVDTSRFRPVTDGEKRIIRDQLGLPAEMKLILFVGHFSREKCPDILLSSWNRYVAGTFPGTGIIFIGSTNPDHYEVDADIIEEVKKLAKPYQDKRIFFIERTYEIEKYYKVSDLFVLPSLREGLPNALLEAMSCGLPVITSRLEGITDWVITDDINGLLIEPGIRDELGRAIKRLLNDDVFSQSLGRGARRTVLERFSKKRITQEYIELYGNLISC